MGDAGYGSHVYEISEFEDSLNIRRRSPIPEVDPIIRTG
jgi:hypothetical protein